MQCPLALTVLSLFAVVTTAQHALPAPVPTRFVERPPFPLPRWFAADTHEHVQYCDEELHTLEELLAEMQGEDLNIANVLVWERPTMPFTQLVCRVTGEPDPLSTATELLQYGVETSGLDCAKWGHLIALGVAPPAARIAAGALKSGDCADMPGLGLGCVGGDGTGALDGLVAEHFAGPGVVCGYAHCIWTLGLQHPAGYDWQTELLAPGFTTDARWLDPAQRLAVPDLEALLDEPSVVLDHGGPNRAFLPLLGAMDAALGSVQFFETTFLGASLPVNLSPPANWNGLWYKLLSAGLRVGLSGGSDRACPSPLVTEHPRTYVLLDELSYPAWLAALAAGRTTVGLPGIRIELEVDGKTVGEELDVPPSSDLKALVEVHSSVSLTDTVELVVDGNVVDQLPVQLSSGGSTQFSFSNLLLTESSWIAARLGSQRAHTGAVYAIVEDRPIADGPTAEYWMLWCDAVEKTVLDRPELALFECQEGQALARIEDARRVFKALRDVDGFDPAWGADRYGKSTAACGGPIAIGTSGPVVAGVPFRISCVHAPPSAEGELYVSRRSDAAGPCVDGVRQFVSTDAQDLVGVYPVSSTRGGYAEVEVPALPPPVQEIHAQFRWTSPPGCAVQSCSTLKNRSASDALHQLVQ